MLAIATIGLVLTASPARAAQERKFRAVVNSFTYADYHAAYNVFDLTGTGTVGGDFSAETAIHFHHGSTIGERWLTITAANGDLLNLVFYPAYALRIGLAEALRNAPMRMRKRTGLTHRAEFGKG